MAVIILHISATKWNSLPIDSWEWKIFNLYNGMVRWAVPIFVIISGALFLEHSSTIQKIYQKNILRIIAAFIFWSVIYAFIDYIHQGGGIVNAIAVAIQGHYHMWFLFMIVGLYIIVPFLQKIVESNFLIKYFLILSLLFAFVCPQTITCISILSEGLGIFLTGILEDVHFHFALGYAGYFLLGYALHRAQINRNLEMLIYTLGFIAFTSSILLTVQISSWQHAASAVFYDNFTVNVLLEAIAIFVFAKKHYHKPNWSRKIGIMAQYSFGAYLVHALIIEELYRSLEDTILLHSPMFSIPTIAIVIFTASFIISGLLNQVPVLKKYIV